MISLRLSLRLVGLLTALVAGRAAAAAPAAPLEIVVANSALDPKFVDGNMEAFTRRLETLGGWKPGTLRGKAFPRPEEALAYVRSNKVAFAILPVHGFVQGRKELKLDVLGRAVGTDGTKAAFWGVTRSDARPSQNIELVRGLRLATTEGRDPRWLTVLFEFNVDPLRHFRIVDVRTGAEAVAAVLAKNADVALVYETDFTPLRPRVQEKGDLAWVYASGTIPPPPIVAVGKRASAADRKRMNEALAKICKNDGGAVCSRMAIIYIELGGAETYDIVLKKYEATR